MTTQIIPKFKTTRVNNYGDLIAHKTIADLPKEIQKTNSAIIHLGPSPKNGAKIVAIISGLKNPSDNDKTGAMAQVDILVEDTHPVQARKLDLDTAICGDCPLKTKVCYVNVGFGPASKWRAYQRGSYPTIDAETLAIILRDRGIGIRWGAYGDPAMLPFELIDKVMRLSGVHHTSYVHQWRETWFDPRHLIYSMGSIDNENTRELFKSIYPDGRTYRMAQNYENILENEIKCPSKNAQGKRVVTCDQCRLCAGSGKQAKDIVIVENN